MDAVADVCMGADWFFVWGGRTKKVVSPKRRIVSCRFFGGGFIRLVFESSISDWLYSTSVLAGDHSNLFGGTGI